jgi:ATP-dependent Clp protease ATP-binding subunit ClpC
MEKTFHLFVRKVTGGVAVNVLTHPHLASFAADLPAARADVTRVAARLLARGDLWDETTWWPDLKLRRVDVTVRAIQHGRLLNVPMRFSVIVRGEGEGKKKGPVRVAIPRLGLGGSLEDVADLDAYVEEVVRHELHLAPLAHLLEVAWAGDESIETLAVTARQRAAVERKLKEEEEKDKPKRRPAGAALSECCRRLNEEAEAGVLERAYQREGLVSQLAESVAARTRGSALLVGMPSVGKTAIVHELVHRVEEARANARDLLHGLEVYSTSGARIIAGMRWLGQWQERVQRMIDELRVRKAVLHLESLAELLQAGRTETGLDVGRQLLPAIESGDIVVFCEATPEDVARAERAHAAFVQAFRAIAVPPLDPARRARRWRRRRCASAAPARSSSRSRRWRARSI